MLNWELFLFIIILIISMLIALNGNGRKNKKLLDELNEIKETFEKNNEIEYITKGRNIAKILYGFAVVLFLNPIAISAFLKLKFKGWLELIIISIFMLVIDIFIIKYLFKIINKGIKSIEIKDGLLNIIYDNNIKTYNICNIEKLYTRILNVGDSHTRKTVLYLYIKNKGEYKYDEYSLMYSERIIALAILLEYIKQNNINAIDTLTKEEVEEIAKKLETMKINEEEIRHIEF